MRRRGIPVGSLLAALVCVASLLAAPGRASAALPADGSSLDAPELSAGPFITDEGLVWAGPDGTMLTRPEGSSSVLAPPGPPPPSNGGNVADFAWFGRAWWVQALANGVFGGRIGGPLHRLPVPNWCIPGSTGVGSERDGELFAVSGARLYVALQPPCFVRRSAPHGVVLTIDLRSGRSHVLAALPGALGYMAAAGRYLALAYHPTPKRPTAKPGPVQPSPEPGLAVRVLDTATGKQLGSVSPPAPVGESRRRDEPSGVQVDERGDVLVTVNCCDTSPGVLAHIAQPYRPPAEWWWAKASARVGQPARRGSDPVLSDGRVAYLSQESDWGGHDQIDVTDLRDGFTRTAVSFRGSASALGLAFSGNGLAWTQHSTVIDVTFATLPEGSRTESCVQVALTPVQLASLDLRRLPATPVEVDGVPIPPRYAHEPACIEA